MPSVRHRSRETFTHDILFRKVPMMIISLPPDIEGPLTAEAQRRGTTPELLVLDSLRALFAPAPTVEEPPGEGATLSDFLTGYIGTIDGASEAYSDNCGQRFAEGLVEKQQRGRL
jgi:hypothetical protein